VTALSGIAIIFLLYVGNTFIRVSVLVSIILISLKFRPKMVFSSAAHFLALIKARLVGHYGKSNDLKYLITRSPDAIGYLFRDFSSGTNDLETFYLQNGVSKVMISLENSAGSPTWNDKSSQKVASLARYLVLSQISNENVIAGLNLYGCLLRHSGKKVFRCRLVEPQFKHQKVFLDGLMSIGAIDEWKTVHQNFAIELKNYQSVKCDAGNPFLGLGGNNTEVKWCELFNAYFNPCGLKEIELLSMGESAFDRLSTKSLPKVSGSLVTVIVSTFNPGPELLTAIRSLTDQTWNSLEIIIVDDFSDETDYINRATAMDSRVRLLRQSANKGTYAARNLAIRNSTGAFITTHDSDDWAHPQRIELQVKNLLSRGKNVANMSWCIRVSKDLKVSTLGFSERRINASSLMFRRELVERIGYFDEVRKGADSEFRMRIAAQFPGGVEVISFQPLSIIRIGHQSLSRSDFSPSWIHPNRHFYKQSYETWHKSQTSAGFEIPLDSKSFRLPFPSPIAYLNDFDSSGLQVYDVLVAANFSRELTSKNVGLRFINSLIDGGMKVGALNLKPLDLSEPFDPDFQNLVSSKKIQCIPQDTVATVKKLLVIDPEYLLLRSFLPQLLKVQELEIKVSDLQALLCRFEKISGINIEPGNKQELNKLIYRIQENAVSLFDTSPTWFFGAESDLKIIKSLGIVGMEIRLDPANT
jgi:glycosyltransferase involved in cell wall biosynthesis